MRSTYGQPMRMTTRLSPEYTAWLEEQRRVELAIQARDQRMGRATREVSRSYSMTRLAEEESGEVRFQVSGRQDNAYDVSVWRDWSKGPTCTCPDFQRIQRQGHNDLMCKHILAVLLKNPEFRGQLLDLFL